MIVTFCAQKTGSLFLYHFLFEHFPYRNMTEDFSQKALVCRLWYWMIRQRLKIFRQLGRRQKHWVTDSLDDWVTGWLSHWMTESLDDWVTEWLSHWITELLDEWVTGWYVLTLTDTYWYILTPTDMYWHVRTNIDTYWVTDITIWPF